MSNTIGMNFQPGADQGYRTQLNQSQLGPQANEALKIISMHLPAVLGGRPISPDDLLRPRPRTTLTGGGMPSGLGGPGGPGGDLSSLARLIAQALGIGTGGASGSAPNPIFTPSAPGNPMTPDTIDVGGGGPSDRTVNTPPSPPSPVPSLPGRGPFRQTY